MGLIFIPAERLQLIRQRPRSFLVCETTMLIIGHILIDIGQVGCVASVNLLVRRSGYPICDLRK